MWKQLDDLDFADDLLSHKHEHMQEKTSELETISALVGLRIHTCKTKPLGINTANDGPIMLGGSGLEETFTYLGSIVNNHGGTDADVKARIGKASVAFLQLKNTWSARPIATQTKIRIFNSNVKSDLLYWSETRRTTKKNTGKVQTFINNCLRRKLKIH